MPNTEWGTKRLCPTTGKRFYDLNKNPIVNPYTGETMETESSKSRMISADAEDAATLKAKQAEEGSDETSDDVTLDDDDTSDVDLGDDVLDDDDEEETVSLDEIADVPASDDE